MSLKSKIITSLSLVALFSMSSFSAALSPFWYNSSSHAAYLDHNSITIEDHSGTVLAELRLQDTNPTFFALVWNSIKDKAQSNAIWFARHNDNGYNQIYKIHTR